MSLLVVGYPDLGHQDLIWIEQIRRQYDPNYNTLPPHITLVFPIADIDRAELSEHLKKHLAGQPKFPVVFRSSLMVKDAFSHGTHIFLVPDEGFSQVVKLHDKLYRDCLAKHLRPDIPFIPHMTVGFFDDLILCKDIVDELNRQDFEIKSTLNSLDLISIDNEKAHTLEQFLFEG